MHTKLHTAKEFKGRSAHGDYGDNIEEMDWAIGEVLNALDQLGLEKDTFVYFSSDHGAHHNELDVDNKPAGGYNGVYKGQYGTYHHIPCDLWSDILDSFASDTEYHTLWQMGMVICKS